MANSESIHLIIIGAGLAGLAAGISTKMATPSHQVTILETMRELAEIGAGLQLTPNATRLFKPWGIYERLTSKATFPKQLSVHRFDGTKLLAREPDFQEQIAKRYSAPLWGMHRVDLQRAMAARCAELGVTIRLSSKVTLVDFENATVTVNGFEKFEGDVVLCTDGLWSTTRPQFLGRYSPAALTGDLAYRIVIKIEDITGPDAAELKKFIADSSINFWVGPNSHVVAYSMRASTVYNIVLISRDTLTMEVAKAGGDLKEMRNILASWDPLLQKFLDQVTTVKKWKLMGLEDLPKWANETGTFLMAGDCCHPMLSYLAQGASSSLEDGAVLGYLLGKVQQSKKQTQLPRAATLYQDLRRARGKLIQKESIRQRRDFHLSDGLEQEKRDELMMGMLVELNGDENCGAVKARGKRSMVEEGVDFPSRWMCSRVQKCLFGYDAYDEVRRVFERDPF